MKIVTVKLAICLPILLALTGCAGSQLSRFREDTRGHQYADLADLRVTAIVVPAADCPSDLIQELRDAAIVSPAAAKSLENKAKESASILVRNGSHGTIDWTRAELDAYGAEKDAGITALFQPEVSVYRKTLEGRIVVTIAKDGEPTKTRKLEIPKIPIGGIFAVPISPDKGADIMVIQIGPIQPR